MNVIKATLANFKFNFKDFLFFEMIYKLIAMIFFIPINYFIFNRSLLQTSQLHLSNKDVLRFSFSSQGCTGLLLIMFISVIGVFFELFTLMHFANRSHRKQKINLLRDTIYSVKLAFQPFHFYFYLLLGLSGCMSGLFGVSLFNTFIRELRLISFMITSASTSLIGSVCWVISFIGLLLFLMRWFLAIPIYVIEDVSLKSAFRRSVMLYKQQKRMVMSALCGIILFNLVFKSLLLVAYLLLGQLVFSVEPLQIKFLVLLYLIIFIIGYLFLSLLSMPLFLSYLTELYYRCVNFDVSKRNRFCPSFIQEPLTSKCVSLRVYVVVIFCVMIGLSTSSIWFSLGTNITQITAHRGSSLKAPENTLSSIAKAIDDKVEFAEIDVTLTKDGHVVLFHDKTLKRMTGSKQKIKNMTLEELQTLQICSSFNNAYKFERIPTLEDILILAKGKIKLNIELKTYGEENELPVKVATLIQKYNMEDEVIVSSMDYSAATRFKSYMPLVDVGYIITTDVKDLNNLNVDFVSIEYRYLSKELLYAMHALDKEVHVWTVNQMSNAKRAALLGVDYIITDQVDGVKLILKNEKNQNQNLIVMLYDGVATILRSLKL